MSSPFRFVVVGSGSIAATYVEVIRTVPGAALVGIVSRSGRSPRTLGSETTVEVRPSLGEIRSPFDGAVLATPNGLHAQGAIEAAALGKHVLTEKPLAVTRTAADAMMDACRSNGVTLGVCYQRRTSPDNAAVGQLIHDRKLGRIFAVDLTVAYYRDQRYYDSAPYRGTWAMDGGGAFMQQASHQIDLYCWMFGLPEEVRSFCSTVQHRMEAEDHGAAILRHADGMTGTIVASTIAKPGFAARFEIHAEAGSVVLLNDLIVHWSIEGIPNPSVPQPSIHDGAASAAVADLSGHRAMVSDFIKAVRERREPIAGGESARMATELILRIYEAAGVRPEERGGKVAFS
jgi:UDP-N-acetyl-2-amino-2-deoxyglucuronate dehydrogenase